MNKILRKQRLREIIKLFGNKQIDLSLEIIVWNILNTLIHYTYTETSWNLLFNKYNLEFESNENQTF